VRERRSRVDATFFCYTNGVREGDGDRFPGVKRPGLVGIILVGGFFIAMGLHSLRTGLSRERPTRPYLQLGIGFVMVVPASAELIRRWWRDRAGPGRR
jgi:hypothetical protein